MIIIVGALAVFVVPRFDISGFSEYSFHQELLAAMRHAQKTANASGCEVQVEVEAADDSYAITFTGDGRGTNSGACADSTTLAKPGGSGGLSGRASDRVAITSTTSFVFNEFGVPVDGSGQKLGQQRVTLSGGREVVIEANTGYVHD